MNDTHIQIDEKMKELLSYKSPAKKMEMGCSMFMFAKTIVIASLKNENSLSKINLRQQLFLRFYGNDFDKNQKKKILKHLSGCL